MRNPLGRWALTFGAVSFWALPADAAASFPRVRAMIQRQVDGGRVPSCAVAVAWHGEIVWEEAFGWADRERRVPAAVHTRYSLASVSKPLTATALLVLVEHERLELDAAINGYLGEARLRARVGDPAGATVRQVADHTSGLPIHHHFIPPGEPRPSLAETIRRYGNLIAEPGTRFEYSNLGYGVLEYLIERVSGRPFARFMSEEIFAPLGLEHTAVLQEADGDGDLAVRYGSGGQPLPFYGSDHGGGSAAVACVHDLVRFGLFHLRAELPDQASILSTEAIRAMQRPSSRRPGGLGEYGIGWTIQPAPRGSGVVRHDGGMPGASASLVLVPARTTAVAVLCNARTELPQRVSAAILEKLRLPTASTSSTEGGHFETGARWGRRPRGRLVGRWKGSAEVDDRRLPVTLVVERSAAPQVRLGEDSAPRPARLVFRRGALRGWLTARLGEDEEEGRPQRLRLDLTLRGDRLQGVVTAFTHSPEGLPSALSHWVDLARDDRD